MSNLEQEERARALAFAGDTRTTMALLRWLVAVVGGFAVFHLLVTGAHAVAATAALVVVVTVIGTKAVEALCWLAELQAFGNRS